MTIGRLHYVSQQSALCTHLDAIDEVLASGGKWIQLRVKDRPVSEVLELALESRKRCTQYGATLIINDDPYVAAEAGADGVHLGLSDMSVPEARKILGPGVIIGGTANTFSDIARRVADGVDYIGLGPCRFTTTKANLSPVLGLDGYRLLMQQVKEAGFKVPVIAVGGILGTDIPLLREAGLYGVAVSGALTGKAQLRKRINEMYMELER